jgi:glycosyltransferase involved in cell wall biosynthesis
MITAGLKLIEELKPELIWVSAPPFDALKVATVLSEQTDLPLIVDYRDPMTWGWSTRGASARSNQQLRDWEARVLDRAARAIVVSPMIERRLAAKYPQHASKIRTITNGFDDWAQFDRDRSRLQTGAKRFTLSYVGTIYVDRGQYVRSPVGVFDGLRLLGKRHPEAMRDVRLRFIGRRCPDLAPLVRERDLGEQVELCPAVSYDESHRVMCASDALLLLQTLEGAAADAISGKVFDYLAARRPILGVVTPGGGDDWLLRQADVGPVVGTENAEDIAEALGLLWQQWRDGRLQCSLDADWLAQFNRNALAAKLADEMKAVLA